jgi:hypothetical protein
MPYVGPSEHHAAWHAALGNRDESRLKALAERDQPGVAIFELAVYVNGRYLAIERADALGAWLGEGGKMIARSKGSLMEEARPAIELAAALTGAIRRRLGWRQREIDLSLMRWIRRSSTLSVVLGVGATIAAGGPSWPKLVRLLLTRAVESGREIADMVPDHPTWPEGGELSRPGDSISFRRKVTRVERLDSGAELRARQIISAIERDPEATDTETLKTGAQLCADLWGRELFQQVTPMLYGPCPKPGPIHRAIADLAGPQSVPERGPATFPGWDAIITYNFDDLMGEALDDEQIPRAVYAMSGGQMRVDMSTLAEKCDWKTPIYHLHGYTPRRPFLITNSEFVFSTHQYAERYGRDYEGVLRLALEQHLARPVRVALYIGCSFQDDDMNNLLARAAQIYPGRLHVALLQWPEELDCRAPDAEEVVEQSARYLQFGVQPLWFERFDELPTLIAAMR